MNTKYTTVILRNPSIITRSFLMVLVLSFHLILLFPSNYVQAQNFSWCSGRFTFEADRWGYDNGIWTVYGWFYHRDDTHVNALRIDGSTTYSTANDYSTCPVFTNVTAFADDLMDYSVLQYEHYNPHYVP